ncbi:MAG: tetratricopeptide repeat protein [Brevinema sp.]
MPMNKKFSLLLLTFLLTNLNFALSNSLLEIQQSINAQDYAKSFALLQEEMVRTPNNTHVYRLYAELLLELENYGEALTNINQAITLSQADSENHRIAGNIYRAMNDYTNASAAYARAVRLDPNSIDNYHDYAILNAQFGRLLDATRLLKLAENFDTSSWKNYLIKAKIAVQQNKLDEGKKILFDAVNLFPSEEDLIIELANIYIKLNQPNQAIALLKEANKRFSATSKKNSLIADILFANKKYEDALENYLAAQKIIPPYLQRNRSQILWKLFNLYYITGDLTAAEKQILDAIAINKNQQLYQSAYYNFLLNTQDNNSQKRKGAANRFLELSFEKKNQGISLFYVSLLQKASLLDPMNIVVKDQLLEYAKIRKDGQLVDSVLREIGQIQTEKSKIQDVIRFRNHLIKTKRLNIEPAATYQFKHLVFIEPRYDLLHKILGSEIQTVEQFYPNIRSSIEVNTSFLQNSTSIFQNNKDFEIITSINFDSFNNLKITSYDYKGMPIKNMTLPLSEQNFTDNVLNYAKQINSLVPNIGFIKKRLGAGAFEISLGTQHQITNNMKLSILDKNFRAISEITITNSSETRSVGHLSGRVPNIELVNAYVIDASITDPTQKEYFDLSRLVIPERL